jgi:uncharacterized ferredoxin-like protein
MAPLIEGKKAEREAILQAAKLIVLAARTAPKTAGVDDVVSLIVYGSEKNAVAEEMNEIATDRKLENFRRDAKNVMDSEAVILLGLKRNRSVGLNCGACGFTECTDFDKAKKKRGKDFEGPQCVFKCLDLGIALGSAVKIASLLNVDNRIMYRIGAAAMKLKMIQGATIIIGIPISASGKSIYFDRARQPLS